MKERPYILLADDDPNIATLVRLYLERENFEVRTVDRGDDVVTEFHRMPPDLVLLDVMLPGLDGFQVLKTLRKGSNIPVIMLTARDETFDKVLGLELGADDYITKPFEGKELVARIKAVLRRTSAQDSTGVLSFPGLSISIDKYEVRFQGNVIEMPPKELEVLYFLASHQNRVFTREQLLEQVWGFEFFGDSRTVDVHIKRLREKLTDTESLGWQIRTVWGVGYKFEVK